MKLFSSRFLLCLTHLLVLLQHFSPAYSSKPKTGPATNVTKHLSYPNFSSTNNYRIVQDIKLLGSAKLSNTQPFSLQIPDESQAFDLKHQAGRALYSSPIRLFDPPTETPASFQTTFSFQFHNSSTTSNPVENTTTSSHGGSGLTFIIVPDEFTVGRPGPWLAMINDACDEDYKTFAVEFDTRWNPEFGDPSDNHVGINLGTMVSTKAINASDVGVFLNDGSVHRAWISYDGPRRWIDIRLGSDTQSSPPKPVFSGPLDISPFLKEYMFVGFSASTGNHTQIHSVLSWNFTSTSQAFLRVPSSETCESKIVVGNSGRITRTEPPSSFLIFMAVVVLALAVMVSLYYNGRRKRETNMSSNDVILPEKQRPMPPNKPRKFTTAELCAATVSFDEIEILGSDSKGVYYRGKLTSNGSHCQVAIKRFSSQFLSSMGSESKKRLMKEITSIAKVRHPNLVPIRGWCQDNRETMVVYEFIPNGSLDKWLFGVGVLPWTRRFKVVKDVAEGLNFLHSKQLAHKNLKPTSVFLDVSFRAVLGDFGFVLCGAESRRFESAVSQSADVFEFGLLVLEVVAGKRRSESFDGEFGKMGLLEMAWRLHESDEKVKLVDKRMGSVMSSEQAVRVLEIGLLCTLNENKGRPSMDQVVEFLSMERPLPELPLSRPVSLFPYSSMNAGLCTGYSCGSFK